MKILPSLKIFLDESKIPEAGRGVFALKKIKKDEVIERSPVVIINENQVPHLRKTKLIDYYFMWGGDK